MNCHGLFNAKAILLEEQQWYYLTHSWEDKGVHTFPRGICPKVNVKAQLEFELAYYNSAVNCFNHYTTRTSPYIFFYLFIFFLVFNKVVSFDIVIYYGRGLDFCLCVHKGKNPTA